MRISLLLSLGAILLLGGCKNDTPTGPEKDSYPQDFETLWTHFDKEYCYFDFKNIDWQALHGQFRPVVDTVQSAESLVGVCVSMLSPLRDGHVYFRGPDGSSRPTRFPQYAQNWDQRVYNVLYQRYHGTMVDPVCGYAIVDSILFVGITAWDPTLFSVADFDRILDSCGWARGIILDVRPNGGGSQIIALQVAGRFTSHRIVGSYYRIRNGPAHSDLTALTPIWLNPRGWTWTKPVAVLTGRTCFSSNEGFISAMRNIPGVETIGDTTGGGSGNPAFYRFPNGWTYSVPQWMECTADSAVIEWNGIAPDLYVKADEADFAAGTDPVFEIALARIKARADLTRLQD